MKQLLFLFLLLSLTSFSQEIQGCRHYTNLPTGKSTPTLKRSSNSLMDNFDVKFYNIDLDVSNLSVSISGFVEVGAVSSVDNLTKILLNLKNTFTVDSVTVNNKKGTFSLLNNELSITPVQAISKNAYFKVKVFYKGSGSTEGFGSGMINSTNSYGSKYTFTASEPYQSYLWWPCKQELNDKADSVYINITTEATNQVAANGLLKKTTSVNGNKKRFEWKTYYPIDYYLIAFSTGPYVVYNSYAKPVGSKDSILIQDFVYNTTEYTNNKSVIDQTKKLIEVYSEKFGLYPFSKEKYGHFMSPNNLGALENQTMTMLGNRYNLNTVAHELSHQWFGDNVTCASWQDLWLHEGFAEYFGTVLGNELLSKNTDIQAITASQTEVINTSGNCAYLTKSAITDPYALFDHVNTYSKGATVLHMLRFELGNALFFKVLTEYNAKFHGKNATTDSLVALVHSVTGKDYKYFFDQWIYGSGTPSYDFVYVQKGDTIYINSKQSTTSITTPFFKMKLDFLINRNGGTDTLIAYQTKAIEDFKFYYPGKTLTSITPNPSNWNLMKVNTNRKKSNDCKLYTIYITNPYVSSSDGASTNFITLAIPYTSNLKSLIAGFSLGTGATAKIGNVVQQSGVTVNNFSNTVIYTVIAEDGTSKDYTIVVNMTAASSQKVLSNYSIPNSVSSIATGSTINIVMPYGTNVKALKSLFTVSNLAIVKVGNVQQTTNVTTNDFTNPVVYRVFAQDSSFSDYTVTVTLAPISTDNLMYNFSFNTPYSKGTINGNTITVTVPYGTNLKALAAVFSVSNFATVKVGSTVQSSYYTNNDFTNPVVYTVTAQDGSTKDYTVNVLIAAGSSLKDMLLFSIQSSALSASFTGTISGNTISVTLPFGASINSLAVTFTCSANATVKIGSAVQSNDGSLKDFTKAVIYTVVAQDGSTKEYTVNVTTALPSSEKKFLTYYVYANNIKCNGYVTDSVIYVAVPLGSDITNLSAYFTTSINSYAKVGSLIQSSSSTKNNFTQSVVYTLTAQDGSTKNYTVIVSFLKSSAKELVLFDLVNVVSTKVITGTTILITVPYETDLKSIVAKFTVSNLATLKIGNVAQVSGVTSNDFTNAVQYSVIAEDGTFKNYTVNILRGKSPIAKVLEFGFVNFTQTATITDSTIALKLPNGTNLTNLQVVFKLSEFASCQFNDSTFAWSGVSYQNFATKVRLKVIAQDGTFNYYMIYVSVDTLPVTSGLKELSSETMNIYPNPTSGIFYIDTKTGVNRVRILDIVGKEIYTFNSLDNMTFDVSSLTPNVYFVEVDSKLGRKIFKIEKK